MTTSSRYRKEAINRTKYLYVEAQPILDYNKFPRCFYCGELADTKDHVLPVAYIYSLYLVGINEKSFIVDACKECNSIASDKIFNTFVEKQEYIKNRLGEKYKKLLDSPKWNPEEINEMKGMLKKVVKAQEHLRQLIINRMSFETPPIMLEEYDEYISYNDRFGD